jgi:hypothetical protein
MKKLLNGKHGPVTNGWGFLKAPVHTLVPSFERWLVPQGHDSPIYFRSNLDSALARLANMTHWQKLLLSTDSPWTAVFADNAEGIRGEISSIVPMHGCPGFEIVCVEDTYDAKTGTGEYGAIQFDWHMPNSTRVLNNERSISLINNCGKWEFDEDGIPLPFERLDRYKLRRKRDRFTAEMLEEYCLALGIRLFDPDFYGPNCYLFLPPKRQSNPAPRTGPVIRPEEGAGYIVENQRVWKVKEGKITEENQGG